MTGEQKDTAGSAGFKVSDRRHFTSDGERVRDAGEPGGEEKTPQSPPSAGPEPSRTAGTPAAAEREQPGKGLSGDAGEAKGIPSADFLQVVDFLSQNAAYSLGLIPDPATGAPRVDLGHASHFIDLLEILRQKTAGNLTSDEARSLQEVLAQLKSLFVRTSGLSK